MSFDMAGLNIVDLKIQHILRELASASAETKQKQVACARSRRSAGPVDLSHASTNVPKEGHEHLRFLWQQSAVWKEK